MPYIIHVHRQVIDSNRKNGTNDPPLIVRKGTKRIGYAHEVELPGKSRIVHSPHKPLDCGARVWIETDTEPIILEGTDASRSN